MEDSIYVTRMRMTPLIPVRASHAVDTALIIEMAKKYPQILMGYEVDVLAGHKMFTSKAIQDRMCDALVSYK